MNKVFYHSADLDGIGSGFVASQFLADAQLFGYDYGRPFPWHEIDEEDVVYMIDVSMSAKDMEQLQKKSRRFVWIDHHKSAMDEMKAAGLEFEGIQRVGLAGIELTWDFLLGQAFAEDEVTARKFWNPGNKCKTTRPYFIHHLGRYDVWDHGDDNTLPFQYAMRGVVDKYTDSAIWKSLWTNRQDNDCHYVRSLVENGRMILAHISVENMKYACATSHVVKWKGKDWIVINRGLCNSKLFDSVYDSEKHDGMMSWYHNKQGVVKVSLYSDRRDVDVSDYAIEMGGGGHANAAGFMCSPLDFLQEILGVEIPTVEKSEAQDNSETLTIQLEASQLEVESLKARIAELEAQLDEFSSEVADVIPTAEEIADGA